MHLKINLYYSRKKLWIIQVYHYKFVIAAVLHQEILLIRTNYPTGITCCDHIVGNIFSYNTAGSDYNIISDRNAR